MGAGASVFIAAVVSNSNTAQLSAALADVSQEERQRLLAANLLTETEGNVAWSQVVPIPRCYLRCSAPLNLETQHRAITIAQVNELAALVQNVVNEFYIFDTESGVRMMSETVNLYHINDHVIKPLTLLRRCSFVSLLAEQPQVAKWFVSHWWGTPFRQTTSLLNFHCLQRALPVDTAYWICTFANNQHDLTDIGGRLEETPFAKAILERSCDGTLALLDGEATTFSRIWCIFEMHVSTVETRQRGKKHLYDLAAWLQHGLFHHDAKIRLPHGELAFVHEAVSARPSALLDDGKGHVREAVEDDIGGFPWKVAMQSVELDVSRAEASQAEDRQNILHMIVGTPLEERHQQPPVSHEAYDSLNHVARRRFAPAAISGAAQSQKLQTLRNLLQRFPDAIDDLDALGSSPLTCATCVDQALSVEILLAARANPNVRLHDGATSVFLAAQRGFSTIVESLIGSRADIEIGTHDEATPCFVAAQNGHVEVLRLLIKAKADFEKRLQRDTTPLIKAACKGHTSVVELLLEARADTDSKGTDGTALDVARAYNRPAIEELLECHCARKLLETVVDTVTCQDLPDSRKREGFRTLLKILSNIQESPQDPKFRRIRKDNTMIHGKLFPECFNLLCIAGFVDEGHCLQHNRNPDIMFFEVRATVESLLSSLPGETGKDSDDPEPCASTADRRAESAEVDDPELAAAIALSLSLVPPGK